MNVIIGETQVDLGLMASCQPESFDCLRPKKGDGMKLLEMNHRSSRSSSFEARATIILRSQKCFKQSVKMTIHSHLCQCSEAKLGVETVL